MSTWPSTSACACSQVVCPHGCVCLQVGSALSLADVSVVCAALPLFQHVLSVEARQPFPAVSSWISTISSNGHFSKVLGELTYRAS